MEFAPGAVLASPWQWLAVPAVYAYGVLLEWGIHRYVFHGLGRRRGSPLSFHYRDHHRACRKNDNRDPAFAGSVFAWNAYGREALGLVLLALLHAPMLLFAPLGYAMIVLFALNYHRVHRRCHADPEWGRLHAPWHWDHHMGPGEHNWCVTTDWLDRLMGTRRVSSASAPLPAPLMTQGARNV